MLVHQRVAKHEAEVLLIGFVQELWVCPKTAILSARMSAVQLLQPINADHAQPEKALTRWFSVIHVTLKWLCLKIG